MSTKMKLELDEETRLHLEELEKALAGSERSSFSIKGGAGTGCGEQCMVTCAYACMSNCTGGCDMSCDAVCRDFCDTSHMFLDLLPFYRPE